ncbi:2OG-Fe(II) oxygenase [Nostocaceae cyanobacterium CENA369]|uniref:2OG-Fe(II) oxygenase n=1 Tax=Dendronalium phyllosphericum CENA369 TaxID=1725256 RepID=A0A8J7LD47_9NOST|nr:2OG-Fe(II) oxygenase [Dendronalium phyllosphericum]MBH8573532.1 2OG-Fe(II) oxygenase [Dendronalium phyllosphericum CENA369]
MYKFIQKARNKFIKKIDAIPFIRYQADLAYQTALEKHISQLPAISTSDFDLIEKIKHEGVVITSLEDLKIPSTPKLLQAAENLIPKILSSIAAQKNDFTIHASAQQIMEYPEIFLWGLEQRLLNIVENYLGLPVAYHGAYFRRDIANQVEQGSRLWHIDKEDRKVLKIIVYLNDISEDKGPFQYIPQSLTAKVVQSLKYTSGYIRNQTLQEVISPANYKSCTGDAGTVIFAATSSILHRGKPPVVSERFAIFFDYTSRRQKQLLYCNSSLPHSDLLLLANNLTEKQKECIFWE